MSLTIIFKDTHGERSTQCDDIQTQVTSAMVKSHMLYPSDFDILVIDLGFDIERVACYLAGNKVYEFGGAIAWNIYRAIATIWPEINYHTAGRPAIIL